MIEAIYNLREYHNMQHLEQMTAALSEFVEISEELQVAINYHDIVYEVGSKYNEEFSAIIAAQYYPEISEFTGRAIRATKEHKATGYKIIDLFLDADMSILAAEQRAYNSYSKNIRKEYAKFSDSEWVYGRKKFLQSFKGFITPEFSKYNQMAFDNISRELECL